MRTIAFSHDAIIAPFFDKKILTKAELLNLTGCSNMTLFRRLSEHGYYTSYNFNSRYFTIVEVAKFDRKGLWEYHEVRFSKHGTLKATIRHFVSTAEMGCTANDLAQLLGVRVASLLLPLTNEGLISRENFGGWLYFSSDPRQREQQINRRRSTLQLPQQPTVVLLQQLDDKTTIEALVGLVKNPDAGPKQIRAYLKSHGMVAPLSAINALFERYDLFKKKAIWNS
ncbi:MAG: hypothetical protein ACRENW_02235 [Thermodesulfobacteriota bacterium]